MAILDSQPKSLIPKSFQNKTWGGSVEFGARRKLSWELDGFFLKVFFTYL